MSDPPPPPSKAQQAHQGAPLTGVLDTPQDLPSTRTPPAGLALCTAPPGPPLGQSRSATEHASCLRPVHPSGVQSWASRSSDPQTPPAALVGLPCPTAGARSTRHAQRPTRQHTTQGAHAEQHLPRQTVGQAPRLLANTAMVTVDQVEVVDAAMCLTLPAGCLCWFRCVCVCVSERCTIFFIGGEMETESLPPDLCIFKILRMKRGIQKCLPNAEKFEPHPTPTHPPTPREPAGVGVRN